MADEGEETKAAPQSRPAPVVRQASAAPTKKSYAPTVAMFNAVVKYLYFQPDFQGMLSPDEARYIYAYYMQTTYGPNTTSRPSCLVIFFFGSMEEDKKWQEWANLRELDKLSSAECFLGAIMAVEPDYLNAPIFNIYGRASMGLGEVMRYEAARKIQTLMRQCLSKRRIFKLMSTVRENDVSDLISMLIKGIKIMKLPSNGGAMRKRILALRMGDTLADSRLFTYSSGLNKDSEKKGAYLADIADVRPSGNTYAFKPITGNVDRNECFSIVCSERCFDLQVVPGTRSRDWFVVNFLLLGDQAISEKDAYSRGRYLGGKLRPVRSLLPPGQQADARRLAGLLEKSFGVEENYKGVRAVKSLWVSWAKKRLYIGFQDAGSNPTPATATRGVDIDDIAEIRKGQINPLMDEGLEDASKMLTIVASENTITLVLTTESLRNKLVYRLQAFVALYRTPVPRIIKPQVGLEKDTPIVRAYSKAETVWADNISGLSSSAV